MTPQEAYVVTLWVEQQYKIVFLPEAAWDPMYFQDKATTHYVLETLGFDFDADHDLWIKMPRKPTRKPLTDVEIIALRGEGEALQQEIARRTRPMKQFTNMKRFSIINQVCNCGCHTKIGG